MVFRYEHFTISGSRSEVAGASQFVTKAKEFLEAAGWTTVDDRRTQPGSATDADTHKVVLSSDGEDGSLPTYYMTMASGTSSETNAVDVSFMMSTGYDVGTHDVLSSDAKIPSALGVSDQLNVIAQSDYDVWMSGDTEGVVFVTRVASVYDSIVIGRCNQFTTEDQDPYPLYIVSSTANSPETADPSSQLIAGNPPIPTVGSNQADTLNIGLGSGRQPYSGDHTSVTSIFLAAPIVMTWDRATAGSIRKGIVGTVRNAWKGTGTTAGMLAEGTLTASGTFGVQIYRAFPTTGQSLIIRES